MPNITLAELKAHLLVPGDDRDTQLQLIVNGVNARVVSVTGRDWTRETRIETYRGTGGYSIVLRHYPVTQLLALAVDGIEWDVDDADKVSLNGLDGIVYRVDDEVWPYSRKQNVEVTYIGGPEVVPADLRLATLEMAAFVYQASGGRTGVTSGGGPALTLLDKAMEELPIVKQALEDHRDWMRGFQRGG